MTLLEYRIFHTVTQQGSFARAAQILHLTPSAISHAVSSMEVLICHLFFPVRSADGEDERKRAAAPRRQPISIMRRIDRSAARRTCSSITTSGDSFSRQAAMRSSVTIVM